MRHFDEKMFSECLLNKNVDKRHVKRGGIELVAYFLRRDSRTKIINLL